MKIKINTQLTDRRGNPAGETVGEAVVSIIDTTSVQGIESAGNPRLLARVAERIYGAIQGQATSEGQLVNVNAEEEKCLRGAILAAKQIQYFYHRRLMAELWPDELEDDERAVLLGHSPGTASQDDGRGPKAGAAIGAGAVPSPEEAN